MRRFRSKGIENYAPTCQCEKCRGMCKRIPCKGTPTEMQRIIDAGLGYQLQLDWWAFSDFDLSLGKSRESKRVYILAPGIKANPGANYPRDIFKLCECQLFIGGKCQVHGMKPLLGRIARCGQGAVDNADFDDFISAVSLIVVRLWDRPEGKRVIRDWRKRFVDTRARVW